MPSFIGQWRRRIGLAIAGSENQSKFSRNTYLGSDRVYCTRTVVCPLGEGHEGPCSVC